MFVVMDGGDGSGKSTQIGILAREIARRGMAVATFRDPGSTKLGERIRSILLDSHDTPICDRSESFLFMAARTQMIEEQIRPALDSGKVVLVDRFLLSTVVYQGYAAGVPVADIWTLGRVALGDCVPDLTLVLDVDPETARSRIQRPLDRMELKGDEYHRRVRDGFLTAATCWTRYFPGRCVVVPAQGEPESVARHVSGIFWKQVEG